MEKILKISDDSGFIGIANLSTYDSFIGKNWNFNQLKEHIVIEINKNNLLFWATGREDDWTVKFIINGEETIKKPFRKEEAIIQVTNNKLYLVNYETLTMAAQFEHVILPENHLNQLFIELDNGYYLTSFCQVQNPELYVENSKFDFEIKLDKINDLDEYYPNDFVNIFWNQY
ncbi:hypothetical protein [Portibacter lacus]|uniref:Uncharacterized protein n=1 Tax=Portibacter lacus TaxID=1099794 RepID=A0AA37WEJ0_9BACT|nr:hypothetical protein [Portibacter lacus]GLR16155.1 hypothetical protein GCM10007940_07700 [Portibacter lacus]